MTPSADKKSVKPVCLITGATQGVGKATANKLASGGFIVVLASRNRDVGLAVKREIKARRGGDIDVLPVDLTSLTTVHELAQAFKARYRRLDVLINNAGVFMPTHELTQDGFEMMYQVNYLAHFLLSHLLLDLLKASAQGRIINLSSSVYTAGKFDTQNLQSEKHFSVFGAYAASKLFMLLSGLELAKRLHGTKISSNVAHPGIVRTGMMFHAPGIFRLVSYLALPLSISADKGAATSVYLASSAAIRGISGAYFVNSKEAPVKSRFNTESVRAQLWDNTCQALSTKGFAIA